MRKTLEDLYFGEIQPNLRGCGENERWKRAVQVVDETEQLLIKLLEGKEQKLFLDLVHAQAEADANAPMEAFIYGFRLGAKLITEAVLV